MTARFVFDLEKLLAPIPGDSPAGTDLRYDAVYDRIRANRRAAETKILAQIAAANRARLEGPNTGQRETDEAIRRRRQEQVNLEGAFNQGASALEILSQIRSDAAAALETRSKDLRLAVWFLEADTRLEGFAGAARGLMLVRGVLERYWDQCFPPVEPEDDDPLGARTNALEWIAATNGQEGLPLILSAVKLNEEGEEWTLAMYDTAKMPPPRDADGTEFVPEHSKETFETLMKGSSLPHLETLVAALSACRAELEQLEKVTDTRLVTRRARPDGTEAVSPILGFATLEHRIDDCRRIVEPYAAAKRPAATETAEPEGEPTNAAESQVGDATESGQAQAAPARRRVPAGAITSREDALARVQAASEFLATENAAETTPYLLSRAIAFGPFWGIGSMAGAEPLVSPPTTVRTELRALAAESNYDELLKAAERFQRTPQPQPWPDLQRYVITALEGLGNTGAAAAVRLQVKALLSVLPDLIDAEFADGTPVANQETKLWLRDEGLIETRGPVAFPREQPAESAKPADGSTGPPPPSLIDEAFDLVRAHRLPEALAKLQHHVAEAPSGRERFLRRLDVAEVCLEAGNHALAYPVLDELAVIIERMHLEDWEDRSLVVRAWSALVRCCRAMDSTPDVEARGKDIFTRLCRLDISTALDLDKNSGSSTARWHRR